MVERLPDTFYSKTHWLKSKAGIKLKRKFVDWNLKQHPEDSEGIPESMPPNIILEKMCDFFETNHTSLRLGSRGRFEVEKLWREADGYLQKEFDRNANAHLLANGKS